MSRTSHFAFAVLVGSLIACADSGAPDPLVEPEQREHHARFIGLWAVEQPTHALYEVTYYDLGGDGRIAVGSSLPPDCTGHLSEHCVTGSVANCVASSELMCHSDVTCVFGDEWYSLDSESLVVVGDCSDGQARDILLAFDPDASSNSAWGGGGADLVSVAGGDDWSHDNWPWVFRKCPTGTSEADCFPVD